MLNSKPENIWALLKGRFAQHHRCLSYLSENSPPLGHSFMKPADDKTAAPEHSFKLSSSSKEHLLLKAGQRLILEAISAPGTKQMLVDGQSSTTVVISAKTRQKASVASRKPAAVVPSNYFF